MADLARLSTSTTVVLRKRKRSRSPLVLRISSSPSPSHTVSQSESEYEDSPVSTVQKAGPSRPPTPACKNLYVCDFEGCTKAYSKPSRLAEHQRSHTGDRPFVCATCQKSYLRESHLQAHTRTHLPQSAKTFLCTEPDCGKRFWTSQHLRVHESMHKGEKPFKCTEPQCNAAFAKQSQLREHACSAHAPPGTKPYRCSLPVCTKSFSTYQKLRAHLKTHDEKRYTCVHASCLPAPGAAPTYFSKWSSLQEHTRTVHPPTCPYPTCNGKTFTAQKGLRAHLKIHAQRDLEAELERSVHAGAAGKGGEAGEQDGAGPDRERKRRRGGEVGRDWVCEEAGCGKDFKSKKALTTHHNVTHLGRRDFPCPSCGRAFGYKHLLQRHVAKLHPAEPVSSDSEEDSDNDAVEDNRDGEEGERNDTAQADVEKFAFSIDWITGAAYDTRCQAQLDSVQCPYPDLPPLFHCVEAEVGIAPGLRCQYVFRRAYDLRRHLLAEHGVEVGKDMVDKWVRSVKAEKTRAQETLSS